VDRPDDQHGDADPRIAPVSGEITQNSCLALTLPTHQFQYFALGTM